MSAEAELNCQLLTATTLDPSSQEKSPHSNKTVGRNVPTRKHDAQEEHIYVHMSKSPRRDAGPRHLKAESIPSEHHSKPSTQEHSNRICLSCSENPGNTEHIKPRGNTIDVDSPSPTTKPSHYGPKRSKTRPDGTELVCQVPRYDDSKTTSTCNSFFILPAEIRTIIDDSVLAYPECTQLYSVYYRRILSQRRVDNQQEAQPQQPRAYHSKLHTPTILLLCKLITAECLSVLRSRTFIIDRLPPFQLDGISQPEEGRRRQMKLTDFIGRATLQNIIHLDLRVGVCEGPLGSAWIWKYVVEELYEILSKRNCVATLRLLIRICDKRAHPANWTTEYGHMTDMATKICRLSVSRHSKASIPDRVTIERWSIKRRRASFLRGRVYEPPFFKENMKKQPLRLWPDQEMFPGSITEFLKPLPPPFFGE